MSKMPEEMCKRDKAHHNKASPDPGGYVVSPNTENERRRRKTEPKPNVKIITVVSSSLEMAVLVSNVRQAYERRLPGPKQWRRSIFSDCPDHRPQAEVLSRR
jgi:hypothetical protein